MLDISIETFSTFFGNTSEDVEQSLFNFKSTCEVFNITGDNVTCQLFLQNLHGDALEWYNLVIPNTITNWDALENSSAKNFIPIVHSYVFSDAFNVATHPPSPIWTQENEVTDLEKEYNQILEYFFESIHMAENENKNSNLQEENFILSYTPYEDLSSNKFENDIDESPPNEKKYFSQHIHVKFFVTNGENP
jgi:hypothetical protein